MADDYTPSMDELREDYAFLGPMRLAEFDRAVAEKAWDEGLNTGIGYSTVMHLPGFPEPENPYRKEANDE